MGMYTEIFVNTDLKKETPDSILSVLKAMCLHEGYDRDELITEAGHPHMWEYLFNNGSYYHASTMVRNMTFDKITKQWSLLGKGDIKNYGDEIQKFFEWIKPWCDSEFIGYHRYEENREPTLMYSREDD